MPGARERPQPTSASPSPSLRAPTIWGGSISAAVPVNAGAGKGPGCPYLTLGSPSRLVPRDLNESLTRLPLGRSVLPPSPRSDNRIQSKDASQILTLTVRTSYAHRPPPPAIKSHFCTSCVVRCLPSLGFQGRQGMGNQDSGDLDPKLEGNFRIIQPHFCVLRMGPLRPRMCKQVTCGHVEMASLCFC